MPLLMVAYLCDFVKLFPVHFGYTYGRIFGIMLQMEMRIVRDTIPVADLKPIAAAWYGDMIKGVVDVEQEILVLGGEYHMDANTVLTENGSKQSNVWGFNIHLNKPREEWIEFLSLINIRPAQGNRQMKIEDETLCARIADIVNKKIT